MVHQSFRSLAAVLLTLILVLNAKGSAADDRLCLAVGRASFSLQFVDESGKLIDGVRMSYTHNDGPVVSGTCELLEDGKGSHVPLCRHMPWDKTGKFVVTATKNGFSKRTVELMVKLGVCGIEPKAPFKILMKRER